MVIAVTQPRCGDVGLGRRKRGPATFVVGVPSVNAIKFESRAVRSSAGICRTSVKRSAPRVGVDKLNGFVNGSVRSTEYQASATVVAAVSPASMSLSLRTRPNVSAAWQRAEGGHQARRPAGEGVSHRAAADQARSDHRVGRA